MAEYSAALNTVIKWEKEFSCELEKVITNGKVTMIKCSLCKKFEGNLNKMCGYTLTWVEGTKIAFQCSPQESTSFDCKWPERDLLTPSKQKVRNWKIAFVNISSSLI